MTKNHYLALLRGINVGGNNIIKMTDLKACFEGMGFSEVKTYIQSGNVLFKSEEKDLTKLTEKIEKTLSKTFSYKSTVVVVSKKQLQETVEKAPQGFGQNSDDYRYDVIFLKSPLQPKEALKEVRLREGVDQAFAGKHALYFSRLIKLITKSYVNKIVALPIYQSMTIRNWNTTSKLCTMMSKTNEE